MTQLEHSALDAARTGDRRRGGELAEVWSAWIAQLTDWQLTATLTFDPKRRQRPPPGPQRMGATGRLAWPTRLREDGTPVPPAMTRDVAERYVKRWLRNHERATGRPVTAIAALEYHKNGWPHFHALLNKYSGFKPVEEADLVATWNELAGFCRLEAPRSVADCAAYAAKYLTKDLDRGTVLLWPPAGPLVPLPPEGG